MIPIREAIETRAWLKAEFSPANSLELDENNGGKISFRLRVTEFSKIELSSVDECAKLSCNIDSNIWKLNLDLVNLCKKEISIGVVSNRLFLVDDDRYEFQLFDDNHLRCFSNYAKQSGIHAFFGCRLPPKIKRSGAFPYELPDELDQLSLVIRNGELREI